MILVQILEILLQPHIFCVTLESLEIAIGLTEYTMIEEIYWSQLTEFVLESARKMSNIGAPKMPTLYFQSYEFSNFYRFL